MFRWHAEQQVKWNIWSLKLQCYTFVGHNLVLIFTAHLWGKFLCHISHHSREIIFESSDIALAWMPPSWKLVTSLWDGCCVYWHVKCNLKKDSFLQFQTLPVKLCRKKLNTRNTLGGVRQDWSHHDVTSCQDGGAQAGYFQLIPWLWHQYFTQNFVLQNILLWYHILRKTWNNNSTAVYKIVFQ